MTSTSRSKFADQFFSNNTNNTMDQNDSQPQDFNNITSRASDDDMDNNSKDRDNRDEGDHDDSQDREQNERQQTEKQEHDEDPSLDRDDMNNNDLDNNLDNNLNNTNTNSPTNYQLYPSSSDQPTTCQPPSFLSTSTQ